MSIQLRFNNSFREAENVWNVSMEEKFLEINLCIYTLLYKTYKKKNRYLK